MKYAAKWVGLLKNYAECVNLRIRLPEFANDPKLGVR